MANYPEYESPHYGKRQEFLKNLQKYGGSSALSSLDSLEAALWLLSVNKESQALFLLHHTLEVAFKSLLEEINVLLVLDSLDYELAKGLAWEKMRNHRLGNVITKHADVESYAPNRTCGFDEAYRRIKEMITFDSISRHQVGEFNKMRNRIVHYGGSDQDSFDYVDAILNVALPWLQEFFEKGYSLSLDDFIFRPVAREILVARQYANLCKTDVSLPRTGITQTFQKKFHNYLVIGSANILFDADGWLRNTDDWKYELYSANRRKLERIGWDLLGEGADTDCIICGESGCLVAVSERHYQDAEEVFYADAIHCPSCGLHIDKDQKALARLHYGPITKERLGDKAWEDDVPR
jgi:hypothetical protein